MKYDEFKKAVDRIIEDEDALRQCGASRSEGAEAESGAEICRGGNRS